MAAAALALGVALAAALSVGCGSSKNARGPETPYREPVPVRTATGGEALLGHLPQGADAVGEVDLARLRANPVVGPLVTAFAGRASELARERLGFNPLEDVDALVIGAYRMGLEDATLVVVARGPSLDAAALDERREDATALDAHTIVVGELAWREGAARASGQAGPSMHDDADFLRLRTLAMPDKATGAIVRITARLTDKARVMAAGQLAIDQAPGKVSLWLDVADDMALVALLGADDEAGAQELTQTVKVARKRWRPFLPLLERLDVERRGQTARVVWLVGPRTLAAWAAATKDLDKEEELKP